MQKTVATKSLFYSKNTPPQKPFSSVLTVLFLLLISNIGFAQLNESFDSGIPNTWTLFGNGTGVSEWSSTTDGYLGTNGASINPSADNIGDQNTAEYFLVTPQLAVPENGEIQFYTKQANEADNGAQYEIRLSTAAQPDINGFNVVLQSYTETNLNTGNQTSYEKKIIELPTSIPAGLNIYIAFITVNTQNGPNPTGDEWFVDEISVLQGCIEVENDDVSISDITVDGAEITWSHPTATNFEIQVLPTGGIPAESGIPVIGTSYTLMNLDADTEFDIYISALCDNDTQSAFSGPYTFETLRYGLSCDQPITVPDISTTPFVFTDNLANWVNPDVSYTTQGSNCVPSSDTMNYLSGDKIFFAYTPTQDGLLSLTQTTFDGGDETNNCYNAISSLFVYEGCTDVGVSCLGGTTTNQGFQPEYINNLLVQAGQTYIIVVSSPYNSSGVGICFELEISNPVCAPPGNFTYNNLTEDSVSFSWDNVGGFSDSWEYIVVPTGTGEPTGSGIATATNTDNIINTGLSPATTYDLYVRSVCNGTPGIWSEPSTFTTQCATLNLPYFTDYSGTSNDNPEPCWTIIDANGDGNTWGYLGEWGTIQTSASQFENYDIFASPRLNFDGTPKRIRYKHRSTLGSSTYSVRLSTTGVGLDNFTTVVLPTTTINNNDFQEIIVDLPENLTGEINIAWIVEPNTTEDAIRISIDDVYIEDKPSCPDPLSPFVIQITTNSAWLFWTAGDTETQWEVAIQDEGTGVPTEDGLLVTDNFPYIATNLEPGNRYEFYVRAYCDTDDKSEWIGPVEFITLCESYDTPFFESFNDDDDNTQKFCWEITDANNDGSTWATNETTAFMQTAPFTPPSSFNDYLISPAINIDGVKELKYKYRADYSIFSNAPRYGLEVLMSTTNTNPGSFSVISPFEIITNSSYEEKSIIIEATGTIYIAFRVPPEFTGPFSILSIDDVSINDAPACPNPSDLAVDTISTDGADLSWTAGYEETAWSIVVQPAGSGVPTANSGVSVSSTNYSVSDLLADTEYEFYVIANCDPENSEWIGPVTFRTNCNVFTTPFVETFNTDSPTESCWQIVNNNNDQETWELNGSTFPYEGDQSAVMFTGTNGQNEDWLISPTITITENQRLRYYYRVNDSFFTEDLEVLLSTNGVGLDQFTTVLYDSDDDPVIINNTEYKVKIINFPEGISGDINIAFRVPFFPSTLPYRGQILAIDNVNIEDVPDCPELTNIVLNNITDTEVQVSWDANGTETPWEISVQPSGTPAPVGDTDPSYLYNAITNPFTVTGLDPSTMYDIYIRAVCNGNASEWTGPEVVTTKCSFDNLCQYTFVLNSDFATGSSLDISQNNQLSQSLPFNGQTGEEFTVFLCSGLEFTVFFNTIGTAQFQYENYQFDIRNSEGDTIYSSPFNILLETVVYEGNAVCGPISCPQPTDLTINETNTMSWAPQGNESQWEVAIQPIGNGTLPQSGTIVSTNSYTPSAADFNDSTSNTYEYFVKAVCGTDDESYWSGPFGFVRNNDITTALTLPINSDNTCELSGSNISFTSATVSPQTMSCDGLNSGDIWFDFTAESQIHIIEINGFTGEFFYSNAGENYSNITMTLYKDDGSLQEIACTYDHVLVAMYTSELVVGDNYKLRLSLNSSETNSRPFNVCIKTPSDFCAVETVNGGFEEPALSYVSGVTSLSRMQVVPGWRTNLTTWGDNGAIFIWEGLNSPGFEPYEGSQSVQLLTDIDNPEDPNDLTDIRGYYRDFDTSEITLYDYSFVHLARFEENTLQLFAGPPDGPFTMIDENIGVVQAWTLVSGEYQVPDGQTTTRFIFRASNSEDIGNMIDAVSFLPNNEIITEPFTVDCSDANATIEANGNGTWLASTNNPGTVAIADANSNTTSISDFVQPGVYTFTWQTRYCSYDLEITYNGVSNIPTVESPISYCLNDTAEALTASESPDYSLIWYTEATGGTGNTAPPVPNTSTATTTSYYVAYVDSEGCEGPRAEITVIVSESFDAQLEFSYENACSVSTTNPLPILSDGFDTGGAFTSSTLTVDPVTGEIDMTSAAVGSHDITYTYNGDSENCTTAGSFTASIEIIAASMPVTGFGYSADTFCILSTANPLPNTDIGFTTGGVFSSSTITVDSGSGAIDLSTANAGSHDITYTTEANATTCVDAGTSTITIEITPSTVPEIGFSYVNSVYCADSNNTLPTLNTGFVNGGTFSAENGLVIDAITGEISVSESTLGNYTVNYTVLEDGTNCIEGQTSTYDITILNSIEVAIEDGCNGSDYTLTALAINDSYDSDNATYTWMDANGNVVGSNSEVFNVTQHATSNSNLITPLQFSVTVTYGDCSTTQTFTAEQLECIEEQIPRGISPDGNGKNDTLDLTGYGVTAITIFNRYGTEVYKFKGTYTNQWRGQSKNGRELPDGTYFYNIEKEDGSSLTGWIYINRAY